MIADENVSTVHGTPTTYYDILHCKEFGKSDISSLRNGTIGATTLHAATVAEIVNRLDLRDLMVTLSERRAKKHSVRLESASQPRLEA